MRRLHFIGMMLLCNLMGCTSYNECDLEGLWQLEEVKVDEWVRHFSPTYVEINANNSFAVSRTDGDLAGIYSFKDDKLIMRSNDQGWFNNTRAVYYVDGLILLRGKDSHKRNAKLKFTRIDEAPTFVDFENRIVGKWELYAIISEGEKQDLINTWFSIDSDGNYSIDDGSGHTEQGAALINPRHHKIFFAHDKTEWRTWFFGRELRMNNDQMDIQYRLRKSQTN